MAVPDMAPGLVAFPDDRGVLGFRITSSGMDERRVPAPGVGPRHPDALPQEVERRFRSHAAAGGEVVRLPEFGARAGVDDDDIERFERMADALEFGVDVGGRDDIAIRKRAEVELHAALEAPVE